MTPLEESLRSSATKVDGCASQVWIVPEVMAEHGISKFQLQRRQSDAMIVRGLIAVLRTLYNGLALNEVLEIDGLSRVVASRTARPSVLATLERA